MLTGLIIPGAALAMVPPPEPVSPPPVAVEELDWLDRCVRRGESLEALKANATIINATGVYQPQTLARFIHEAGDGRLVIYGGDFSGKYMREVALLLNDACLYQTELSGTVWTGAEITGLQLHRLQMRDIKAAYVKWPGLKTRGVNFEGADFTGADLSRLDFVSEGTGASFADVSFRRANLTGASFACGITVDVWCINADPDLRGANLTGADLSGLGLWSETKNADAVLDETIVAPRSLRYLEQASINGPLTISSYYRSPYGASPQAPAVKVSAEEARTLIAATKAVSDKAEADTPSFDCAKAATATETLICGEYESELRRLDRQLAEVWSEVRKAGKGSLAGQRRWLRSRGDCEDRTCLEEKYELRLAELRGEMGPGITLAPDQSVTYHSDAMPLPDAMRSGELYRRLLPVLRDASNQTITLTGLEDGSIRAEGDAVGANAHLCSMSVPSARFDPATGWWSVSDEGLAAPIPLFRIVGRRIIVRYSGNMGDTPDEAGDFVSCGARAGFDNGIDLTPR